MLKSLRKKTYANPIKNSSSERLEVDNWELSKFVLEKLVPVVGYRPFPLNELILMSSAVAYFRPTIIFDWGTHIGKSPRIFYEACRAFEIEAEIHSIDLPDNEEHVEHPGEERGKLVKNLEEVSLHQGDGVDTALKILKDSKNKGKVLFFVDGDHSYQSVERELSSILKFRDDAVILLHDTYYQSPDSNYNVGPHEAINDVLSRSKAGYEKISTETGLPGMTLLYPSKGTRSKK